MYKIKFKIKKVLILLVLTLTVFIMNSKSSNAENENMVYGSPGFQFIQSNKLSVSVNVLVSYDPVSQTYSFSYKLTILPNSAQKFSAMRTEFRGNVPKTVYPEGWGGERKVRGKVFYS